MGAGSATQSEQYADGDAAFEKHLSAADEIVGGTALHNYKEAATSRRHRNASSSTSSTALPANDVKNNIDSSDGNSAEAVNSSSAVLTSEVEFEAGETKSEHKSPSRHTSDRSINHSTESKRNTSDTLSPRHNRGTDLQYDTRLLQQANLRAEDKETSSNPSYLRQFNGMPYTRLLDDLGDLQSNWNRTVNEYVDYMGKKSTV